MTDLYADLYAYLDRYPRLSACMREAGGLGPTEVASALRDAGGPFGGPGYGAEAVLAWGGPRAAVRQGLRFRHLIRRLRGGRILEVSR